MVTGKIVKQVVSLAVKVYWNEMKSHRERGFCHLIQIYFNQTASTMKGEAIFIFLVPLLLLNLSI